MGAPQEVGRATARGREDEPESPRDICFTAALKIIQLTGLLRDATPARLEIALNLHQNALVLAAVVFLFEATALDAYDESGPDPRRRSQRYHTATSNLQVNFMCLDEIAAFKPAAKDALVNLQQLLADRQAAQRRYGERQVNSRYAERQVNSSKDPREQPAPALDIDALIDSIFASRPVETTRDRRGDDAAQVTPRPIFPTYQDLLPSTSYLDQEAFVACAQISDRAFPSVDYTAAAAPWDSFFCTTANPAQDPLSFLGFDFSSEASIAAPSLLFETLWSLDSSEDAFLLVGHEER